MTKERNAWSNLRGARPDVLEALVPVYGSIRYERRMKTPGTPSAVRRLSERYHEQLMIKDLITLGSMTASFIPYQL